MWRGLAAVVCLRAERPRWRVLQDPEGFLCRVCGSCGLRLEELTKVNFFRGIFSALCFESKGSSKILDCMRL